MFNNNIGTIYVERVDATNSSGTLTYTTGISGTQGKEFTNPDGSLNAGDTQKIVVNTNSATLNINGAGGVDKFDIEASSFTKTLTIAGNLGTVPNYEEANNNYDTVRIDLSKTSGVNLDISRLLVSNPNDDGIQIVASKGADNITLVAGANHDVIEFAAGGGASGQSEIYQFDFGNARLSYNQSITIDGVTITNIKAGSVLLATDIVNAFVAYANGGYALGTASTTKFSGSTSLSGTGIVTYVSMTGKFESLTDDWLTASGKPTASFNAGDSFFTLTSKAQANLTDLNFTFDANGNALRPDALKADITLYRAAGFSDVTGITGSAQPSTQWVLGKVASGETAFIAINVNGETHQIKIVNDSGSAGATGVAKALVQIFNGESATAIAANTTFYIDGASAGLTSTSTATAVKAALDLSKALGGFAFADGSADTQLTLTSTDLFGTGTITVALNQINTSASGSIVFTGNPNTTDIGDTQGQIVVDFGQGLLAGQSYSFNGKTVVATKDLTGNEVAQAFGYGAGDAFDGAVIVGAWASNTVTDANVDYGADGSKLIITDLTGTGIGAATKADVTGTGALAVNTNKMGGTTTQQGQGDNETFFADSYVVFSASELGSAAAGSADGVAANIKLVTSALDTITNFDVANDKLLLKHLDGSKYVADDRAANATADSKIYVDTAGNTLSYTITNGIVDFSAGNAEASAMTLDQKVYAAWSAVDGDSGVIAGFEHGGDFYVIATGGQSGSSTDDLVIKLAGVTGITDIGAVLA